MTGPNENNWCMESNHKENIYKTDEKKQKEIK